MKEINDLVEISKYAGERFDLVQAAGGNTSVKLDNGEMIIKASGFTLSDVNLNSGFSTVITAKVASIVVNNNVLNMTDKRQREAITSDLMKTATVDKNNRPSIETLLHSLLLKYTLHTHAIVVNFIVSQKNYKEVLKSIFKNEDIALVDYETPGVELALKLHEEIQTFEKTPNIIFLQNHGLIITTDDKDDIKKINEYVLDKIESYLNIDMSKYKLTNAISKLSNSINNDKNIAVLSDDLILNNYLENNKQLFSYKPFCPDTLVYCGVNVLEIESLSDKYPFNKYKEEYYDLPKVIIYKNHIFLLATTIKKAREIEEVLKFHMMVLAISNTKNMTFLDLKEMAYLSNWEAEKFRQNL